MKTGNFRTLLYLNCHVNETGEIREPLFIREIDEKKYEQSEIPKNCHIVSEQFNGKYWEDCENDLHSSRSYEDFKTGDFCAAWYPDQYNEINIFYFEVLQYHGEYCAGNLYTEKMKLFGTVTNMCIADLIDIDF